MATFIPLNPKHMLVKTIGAAVQGIEALPISIEVHRQNGFQFRMVGLADAAVRESQQRIRAALLHAGFRWPGFRITVNMAPADLRKVGTAYDLPLAIGILAATGQMRYDPECDFVMAGELSLDGSLKPVRGILPMALSEWVDGYAGMIIPMGNLKETAALQPRPIWGAGTLRDVVAFLEGNPDAKVQKATFSLNPEGITNETDFADIQGLEGVKRAVEIAAAGGHNVLMIGPQGVGKTMIAQRIPSILPAMDVREAVETTAIYSAAGLMAPGEGVLQERPFRQPHHTTTARAMLGGGLNPQPGEVSLAHQGVLFLDELPEFKRNVLEVLRQPMEDGRVLLARGKYVHRFPARCMVIAAMNPSPNGKFYNPNEPFGPTPSEMHRYLSRISGPWLDRMDMHVTIRDGDVGPATGRRGSGESSADIRERVAFARTRQRERFKTSSGILQNDQLTPRSIRKYCPLKSASNRLLEQATQKLQLSMRSQHRLIKVARTIADLEGAVDIDVAHMAEAIQYRSTFQEIWQN